MFNHRWDQLVAARSLVLLAYLASLVLAGFFDAVPAAAQSASSVAFTSPGAGAVLQGVVPVTGTCSSASFSSGELSFAYAADTTNTWFTIQMLDQPVLNGEIASWDTTAITDGEYVLRLRVNSSDGTFQDSTVGVQVRNYTAPPAVVPTAAPTAVPLLQIPTPAVIVPSETIAPPFSATPTFLPENPVASDVSEIYAGFSRGILAVLGLSLVLGALLLRRR